MGCGARFHGVHGLVTTPPWLYSHVMTVVTSRTFRSGNSEALRLPRDVAFGTDVELTLVRSGEVLTVFPRRPALAMLLAELEALPRPADIEVRDLEPIPERPGV